MLQLCVVVAACKATGGIGFQGGLPWGRKLSNEMKHFARVTTETQDPAKLNAVVMGRKTWESIPKSRRPLPRRLNIVISTTMRQSDQDCEVSVVPSFQQALDCAAEKNVERIMVMGGSRVYQEALKHKDLSTIYLTEILSDFVCDTFFELDENEFRESHDSDPLIPRNVQEENGIRYLYRVLIKREK